MENRELFKTRWGFILACVGSAVSMGNIWRFPVMVSMYGGLTYIIPYIIFVILMSQTGIIEEFALGRSAKTGPVGAFGMCTKMRGNEKIGRVLGIIPIIGSLMLAISYSIVLGWIIKYVFFAISGQLYNWGVDINIIKKFFNEISLETNSIIDSIKIVINNKIFGVGNGYFIILGIIISFLIIKLGVVGGIEKSNKIMIPILFLLLIILAIYIAFIKNSSLGYKYIFTLNVIELLNPKVWIYAFGQAFFSLSIAGNGSIIYGSYLSNKEDIPFSARNVAIFDTIASLLATFVIIPAMANANAELSNGGSGLMFVYLVRVINGMVGGKIIGIIFFITLFFACISSIINMYEVSVEYLQKQFNFKRVKSIIIIAIIAIILSLIIQFNITMWTDFVSIYICPIGALLAGIMFFYVASKEFVLYNVNLGSKVKLGNRFYYTGKYLYCILVLLILIFGSIFGGIG